MPKTMKRYVLICTQRGVFLGIDSTYAYFSISNGIRTYASVSFDTEEEAKDFGETNLNHLYDYKYIVAEVESTSRFVSVIDLVKAGYGEHCHDMISNLPEKSKMVH